MSSLLSILLMGSILSLALGTIPLGFGMQSLVRLWLLDYFRGTYCLLLPILLMASLLSLDLLKNPSMSAMHSYSFPFIIYT